MEELMVKLRNWGVIDAALRLLTAVVIFYVGRWVARVVRRAVARMLERAKQEETLVKFVSSLVYAILLAFVVIAALSRLGIQTASFVALLGAAGLAVGFALQGSLSNFAAGVLLIIFRPFKTGDYVQAAGVAGVVQDIQIFTTTLLTPDNKKVIIPNAKLSGDNVINFTAQKTRRVDLVIGVAYDADLQQTREAIAAVLADDERVLDEPAPQIAVSELADSSVNFVVRPWTETANYWDVYFGVTEAIKNRLDAEGIGIPFPQRDVHLYNHQDA